MAAASTPSWKAKGRWIDSSQTQIPSLEGHQSKTAKNIVKLQIRGLAVQIIRFNLRALHKRKLGSIPKTCTGGLHCFCYFFIILAGKPYEGDLDCGI